MVRFLHTADWQFGMKARHVAQVGEAVRSARLDTLSRVGHLATQQGAQFILMAGDVFEDNQVDDALVHRVLHCLADMPCPVFVLPGNHDHAGPGSVYLRRAFAWRPANVHLLLELKPVHIGEAVLLPAPAFQKWSAEDPTLKLTEMDGGSGIRIGVAHGSLRIDGRYQPNDFPIALDAATRAGLDYLALGHWHSFYAHDPRTVYAGTPETTKFDERDSGTAALVQIEAAGAPPCLGRLEVGGLRWLQWEADLSVDPQAVLARWREDLEALPEGKRVLLRLLPGGRITLEARAMLDDFAAWAAPRVLFLDLKEEQLQPSLDRGELLDRVRTHPLLGGMLADLGVLELLADPTAVVSQTSGFDPPFAPLDSGYLRARLDEAGNDRAVIQQAMAILGELLSEIYQ
jgi:predicted phosphodiesterase